MHKDLPFWCAPCIFYSDFVYFKKSILTAIHLCLISYHHSFPAGHPDFVFLVKFFKTFTFFLSLPSFFKVSRIFFTLLKRLLGPHLKDLEVLLMSFQIPTWIPATFCQCCCLIQIAVIHKKVLCSPNKTH